MIQNKKSKNFKYKKGVLILITALLISCSDIFAQEDFYPVIASDFTPIKSSGSIYLDSSKVSHPALKIDVPSPSEYKMQQESEMTPFSPVSDNIKPIPELKREQEDRANEFIQFGNTDAFSPPSEYVNIPQNLPPSGFSQFVQEDNSPSYQVSVEDSSLHDDIDFEGRIISGISFKGLCSLSENVIYPEIKSQNGARFNSELLQADLQRIYSTGYFTDMMFVDPKLNEDGTVSLCFILNENIKVKDISIKGNTVFPQEEIDAFVKPLKGLPQNLNLINDAIDKIENHYHEKGYILASVNSVDDSKGGNISIGVAEGKIDKIVFEGNVRTKDYIIERNIVTSAGSVYNEEFIKKDLANVFATQIFEEVDRKIDPSPDKKGEYVVTIKVKEGSSNSVSVGGGIDNALGVFGSVGYNEKNFMGKAQQLSLTGMVGSGILLSDASIKNRMNFNIELNFVEPHFLNADNSLLSKIYYRDLGSYQIPLAIERRFGVNALAEHKVKGYNNLKTNLGVGFEQISLREGDRIKIEELYKYNNLDISKRAKQLQGGAFLNIAPGVKYSTLDNETMPREGLVAKASYIESIGLSRVKSTNGRVAGSVTRYIPVAEKSTLSIGAKGGLKVHGSDMPEVMAFRLGGPYSIRGFKMNGVGTGDAFLMGSAELLTPVPYMDRFKYEILKNLRFAFFVDAGRVFDPTITSKLYDRPLSAITAGVGLRVYIPGVGPISLDYGLPFTNVGKYGNSGGYFTFGTGGIFDNY